MDIKTPKGWRKGQTIFNFLWWLNKQEGYRVEVGPERMADPFHIDNALLDKLFDKFLYENGVQPEGTEDGGN